MRFGSNFYENAPRVIFSPARFSFGGVEGNMQTWQGFGEWQYRLNQGRTGLPTETAEKIKALTASLTSPVEKVKAVYEFLQSKTRYVGVQLGIGGWQTLPAAHVDEKGYGDCKALTNYTQSLLKAVGIPAYYTLVHADRDIQPIDKDFPANYFNHVILCVPLEKDTLWLECTSQEEAFGYLGDFTDNRFALAITPQGGKLLRTPAYTKKHNQLLRQAQIQIAENGEANAQIKTRYQALKEGDRDRWVTYAPEEQKKYLYEEIDIADFEILSFSLRRQKDRIPYTEELLQLRIPKFATLSGRRMFITPNLMNQWTTVPEDLENRQTAIFLNRYYDFYDQDSLTFQVPAGYVPESLPKPIKIESAFGKYEAHFVMENQQLFYYRTFEMNQGVFPKEKYAELSDFLKAVSRADRNRVVLVKNQE
ncbi:MAG: transglutaminase family protein [Microscillaceae bacterium]|nr:transglutaminase family protein [Microscillaceae bacterium]